MGIIEKYTFWILVVVAIMKYGPHCFYKIAWWIYKLIKKPNTKEN